MNSRKQNKNNTPKETTEFTFSNRALYANKDEYIEKDLVFDIRGIVFEPGKGFDGADRWALMVAPQDGRDEELLTFGSNEKRDEQFRSAKSFLDRAGSIRNVRLRKSHNTYYIENASRI